MTLQQSLINASSFARSAATATNSRMSETQARRVLADIKRAQAELTQAKGVAIEEIRLGKERDRADRADRDITARSQVWLGIAADIAHG